MLCGSMGCDETRLGYGLQHAFFLVWNVTDTSCRFYEDVKTTCLCLTVLYGWVRSRFALHPVATMARLIIIFIMRLNFITVIILLCSKVSYDSEKFLSQLMKYRPTFKVIWKRILTGCSLLEMQNRVIITVPRRQSLH